MPVFFAGYTHGCNKIHNWHPLRAAACAKCRNMVVAVNAHPEACRQFFRMVQLDMFARAGGCYRDPTYFDPFEEKRRSQEPQQVLHAAAASKYQPTLEATKQWCKDTYPTLAHYLWVPGTW